MGVERLHGLWVEMLLDIGSDVTMQKMKGNRELHGTRESTKPDTTCGAQKKGAALCVR